MYLFLYNYKSGSKWSPPNSSVYFDFPVLDDITTDYQYHYLGYNSDSGHYLHKIARVAIDDDLVRNSILQIDDDYKALQFRMSHDNFLIGDEIQLAEIYDNPNFDLILADCPIIKSYVDRGATKREDSKYVTKVANAVGEVARNVKRLNGALGDDFEDKFSDLANICQTRISEYKENNKKSANALIKERKVIRTRLAMFKAKEL
jgi:hypothetical protein